MLSVNKSALDRKKKFLRKYRVLQTKIERFEEMAEKNPERREYYMGRRDNCRRMRNGIEFRIDMVDDGVLSEILFQKYICGKSFEQISYALHYSKRQVERLHLKALGKLTVE